MPDFGIFSEPNLQAFAWNYLGTLGVLMMLIPPSRKFIRFCFRSYYRMKRDFRQARREFEDDAMVP